MGEYSTLRDRQGSSHADDFQTPTIALKPIIPYLKQLGVMPYIWEPASGKGSLANALCDAGFEVYGTDILAGQDFLKMKMPAFDAIVTNPPFTLKDAFLTRCYELGKPFALLMPLTALGGKKRQALYRNYGLEIVMLGGRVNFETPSGKQGGAWFETAWFTWGLNIGQSLTFATLD